MTKSRKPWVAGKMFLRVKARAAEASSLRHCTVRMSKLCPRGLARNKSWTLVVSRIFATSKCSWYSERDSGEGSLVYSSTASACVWNTGGSQETEEQGEVGHEDQRHEARQGHEVLSGARQEGLSGGLREYPMFPSASPKVFSLISADPSAQQTLWIKG